jgi:hypothetical protein
MLVPWRAEDYSQAIFLTLWMVSLYAPIAEPHTARDAARCLEGHQNGRPIQRDAAKERTKRPEWEAEIKGAGLWSIGIVKGVD